MKNIFLLLLLSFVFLYPLSAQDVTDNQTSQTAARPAKKQIDPISLESYSQDGGDLQATLVLKNNTDEVVNDFTFQIIYLDMNNKPQDYRNYRKYIEIEPGLAKKIRIDSYERDNKYYYYKSDRSYADHPFKVQFKLKSYNTAEQEQNIDTTASLSQDTATPVPDEIEDYGILMTYLPIFILGLFIFLFFLIVRLARERKRDPAFWVILSFLISPLLAVIILLFIGDKETYGRR